MGRIKIKTDIIYNTNIKKNIKIVHLSDIHFNINIKEKTLNNLKNYILKEKPDYIMITGDIFDDGLIIKNSIKMQELLNFLRNISDDRKVFMIPGNHDLTSIDIDNFVNLLKEYKNIYLLDNNGYEDDNIYVYGVNLPVSYYYNNLGDEDKTILVDVLKKIRIKTDKYKILLVHSPIKLLDNNVLDEIKEYDLVLSGHTHNGMVFDILEFMFPKNRGLISPNKKIFPVIAKGKIEKDSEGKKTTIIINGGFTKLSLHSGKIFSIFNFLYSKSVNKIIIRRENNG